MKVKKSKETCPDCHGKGKVTCSSCNGKGVHRCYECGGTGHRCPVCGSSRPGKVKDDYGNWDYCPNCHGDYNNKKHSICRRCGGEGKVSCSKTERCSLCGGTGQVTMIHKSKGNLRLFKALSLIIGVTGLQYLYINRKLLFILQFFMFAMAVAVLFFNEMLASYMTKFGVNFESVKEFCFLPACYLLLNILLGVFFLKLDGNGAVLNDEYKKGWFWFFAFVFGITGAHLAYTKERLLLVLHFLWVSLPCGGAIVNEIGMNIPVIVGLVVFVNIGVTLFEVVLAKIANAIFDTSFLVSEK